MRNDDLLDRTKKYALRIIRLCGSLPNNYEAKTIGRQLFRSGTSVGAHYHEAHFAKSDADFISKVEGALQELNETSYWMELLIETQLVKKELIDPLLDETRQLIAIMVSIVKKVKSRTSTNRY